MEVTKKVNQLSPSMEVIINASSGAVDRDHTRRVLETNFEASDVKARFYIAETGAQLLELAGMVAEGNAETVVACGGDGTVSAVASMLVGRNKKLGVLPLGTLNHFAKDLRIPLDLQQASRTIIEGHTILIDVAEVNKRIFINNSSLGLYPSLVRHREIKQRLGHGKWPAFLWAGISVLRRYPFVHVRLNADGHGFETRTPFVFIGNNEYQMESFNIGSRGRLDSGQLSLYVTPRTGRLALIKLALRALFKRLRESRDFVAISTNELWVETRRSGVRIAVDGEIAVMQSPLHYRVIPLALRVIVPEDVQPEQ
ncbi:MAG TPA: diacylglycerol kinase family protein [Blastocatellia bacterium]|nr:diacylglycerol kinase family protein [Blastocatellia bacterium]